MRLLLVTALVFAGVTLLAALLVFFVGERGRFLASTREFVRLSGLRLRTLHGYIYTRWTPQYIRTLFRLATGPLPASPGEYWLAERYHGKVLTHPQARAIVTIDRPIQRDLEKIIPYQTARELVLQAEPDIVAYECVCRKARGNGCGPLDVCMVIGRPFAQLVLEHQPEAARRLTRDEALALLAAEHARGHVHSAWFKDAMLGRFYAICNCCRCCCGGIRTMVERGVPMVTSSGYVAEFDAALCTVCGDCVPACPFRALTQADSGIKRDWSRCMGCGVCEVTCAVGAVSLVLDPAKPPPLDVRQLPA